MTVEALVERLHARRNGSGWLAQCPAHEDRTPSLSIHERDGKILFHCHASCSQEAVLAALGTLGIEIRDLSTETKPEAHIAAEYDYTDEQGALLFQVVRFEPKDFRQKQPDGAGGWTWNLNGVRRVPYRLPEVLKTESVLICEGEKDCETARKLGLVATCNAGGAGKWRDEYSETLRGRRVAIITDADDPGRKHAQQVAASLHGKAESVRALELRGAKDLTEWVEKGGTRLALLELIRSASEWTPAAQPTAGGFTLTPLGDLLARPDLPVDYILENRLVAGTVSVVVAKPKVGKSTFARNLCLAVSRGEDFLGLKTKRGECIYLALEEREEEVRADFRALGADGSEPILIHAAMAPAEGILALCDLIRQRHPVLVVVDPLFRLARIRDEKAYAETYAALGPLIDVARIAGTHVHQTHHSGKSLKVDAIDSPLGSTAIGGAVSTVFVMKRTEAYRTIQSVQRVGLDLPETVLQFDPATKRLSIGGTREEAEAQSSAGEIIEFLQAAGESKTEPDITEAVEGKTKFVRRALRQLVQEGKVSRGGGGKRGDPYLYRFSFSCSPYIPGTREQETQNGAQPHINIDEKLVPGNSQKLILVPDAPSEGTETALAEPGTDPDDEVIL